MVDEVKDTTVEAGVDESGAGDDAFHMPERASRCSSCCLNWFLRNG